jgi:hypothetical protein
MSYIAAAAEGERNRRLERESLDKRLDMQKYGIDTSARTQQNLLDFNREKWIPEEERKSTLFGQGQDIYDAQKEITSGVVDVGEEIDRTRRLYENLQKDDESTWFSNFRQGDIEADQYKGFGGKVKKWWRDEGWFGEDVGESGYGDAYDAKYNLTVDGMPLNFQPIDIDREKLKVLPPEVLNQYIEYLQMIDTAGGSQTDQGLLSMFNPYRVQ